MSHDSTKLIKAIDKWLKENCKVGFGEVYCMSLLEDFEEFCSETGALKASPGHAAFGREMYKKGFGKKRINYLTHMTGLSLKKPRQVVEQRRGQSIESGEVAAVDRETREAEVKQDVAARVEDALDDDGVARRMKMETKKRAVDAGKGDVG